MSFDSDSPSFKINNNQWEVYNPAVGSSVYSGVAAVGQWTHYAYSRSSGTTKIFINGIQTNSFSDTQNVGNRNCTIGAYPNDTYNWKGGISNVRVVKGTALYTSSFKPPTAPLTNVTNTKLLCCNNTSVGGSTVTPGTITPYGSDISSSTDSPFDDPDCFQFGEDEDQNLIKCGVYGGNSSVDGAEIYLGWEPQWILFKVISKTDPWYIADTMRRISTDGVDNSLLPNSTQAENDGNWELLDVSSTGWKPTTADSKINGSGHKYIYIAMRRPDPLVAKPPEAGTDVFAIDTGSQSSNIPLFDSGFKVDFGMIKNSTGSDNWWAGSRLTQFEYIEPNRNVAGAQWSVFSFDHTEGFSQHSSYGTNYIGWMWKRHAGFDVVTYKGDGQTHRQIPHNLGKAPEMMWLKPRDSTGKWNIYHKEANGGVNPEQWYILLDSSAAAGVYEPIWQHTPPTATDFTVGNYTEVNDNSYSYLMMLFASVDGISKVGSYTGNGNANGPTVPLGFAPKFILIKGWGNGNHWYVYDTTRGISSGNDQRLQLNDNGNQTSADDIDTTATGFQVVSTWDQLNGNNTNYLYYAHA